MLHAYYLDESVLTVQTFPVGERFGAAPHEIEEGDRVLETEFGKKWVYKQFSRRVFRIPMRLTEAQLDFFKTLHEAVGGIETPFYYMVDSLASTSTGILVRKEPQFQPQELDQPAVGTNGTETTMYDYTLILTEEPTGPEVAE